MLKSGTPVKSKNLTNRR